MPSVLGGAILGVDPLVPSFFLKKFLNMLSTSKSYLDYINCTSAISIPPYLLRNAARNSAYVLVPFTEQAPHSSCKFSMWSVPPLALGTTWSTVYGPTFPISTLLGWP